MDDLEIGKLQEELEKLQKDIKGAPQAPEESPIDDEAALKEMLEREKANLNGAEEVVATSTPDELIEETEVVTGPENKLDFQAETRKILDIVAKSIYSDKEVFIRELISNSSDALEKVRYRRITGKTLDDPDATLKIQISADENKKVLIIQDNGIGMSKEELIEDLGRIGHSGTGEFLKVLEENQSGNLIGKFGVGFYSTFMVAKNIRVYTKSAKDPNAKGYVWSSDGMGSYSIAEADGVSRGTKIVIELLDECEEFSKKQTLESIVKKYSNFVGFDITLNGQKVNTVKALWTLPPSQISEADHKEFYQFIAHAYDEPLFHFQYNADSPINVRALFYIPEQHMEKYGLGTLEPGVSLFSRKVLIQAKCKGLLPDWLRFIKGVVDSEDVPLNLSREHLQDSTLIKRLSNVLTRRVLKFFDEQSKKDEEKYMKFYNEFNQFLKQGICSDLTWKEDIAKLLRMDSSRVIEGTTTTFDSYLDHMKEAQREIYYLISTNRTMAEHSPYYETFRKKGVEVLFLYTQVDDFVMTNLAEFKGKKIVSIETAQAADAVAALPDLHPTEETHESTESLSGETFANFSSWLKEVLSTRVTTVTETQRLSSSPAVVVDHESASFRRMMKFVDPSRANSVPKVQLQVNTKHPIIKSLNEIRLEHPDLAKDIADQIMDNAMIQAGLMDDSRSMIPRLNKILEKAMNSTKK